MQCPDGYTSTSEEQGEDDNNGSDSDFELKEEKASIASDNSDNSTLLPIHLDVMLSPVITAELVPLICSKEEFEEHLIFLWKRK
jgi:hypothetical protein